MKNWIIAALVAVIAIGGALGAFAATQQTDANVDVTVWQRVSDGSLYLSTRPEGGTWTTHQTALDMSQRSRSGNFRQGSAITVSVPVTVETPDAPEPTSTPTPTSTPGALASDRTGTVTVRVWENTSDGQLWISAIKDGQEHHAYRLDLDAGPVENTAGERFRYGDMAFPLMVERVEVDRCSPVDITNLTRGVFQVSHPAPGGGSYTGTAWHVSGGLFMTAGHVVDKEPRPTWVTLRNRHYTLRAKVIDFVGWLDGDLAVLRVYDPPASLPSVGPSGGGDGYFPGGIVTAAGYPQGHTALVARVWSDVTFLDTALYRQGNLYVRGSESSYYLSGTTGPGSSGGPVLDACSQMEGMIVAGGTDPPTTRFIDIETILNAFWRAVLAD